MAIADLWEQRTGRRQRVQVDIRRAAASLRSHSYLQLNGQPYSREQIPDLLFSRLYRCRDGRWIHTHGGLPHLAAGTARVLGCAYDRDSIAEAVARWDSQELADGLAEAGMCGAIAQGYRTGVLERRGFGPEALAQLRPGIV